jgi:SAM-dependent methyltransferase
MTKPFPYPPHHLADRVGSLRDATNPREYYDELGRKARSDILERLPQGWTFSGKRVLDFGCGAGRVLRHFGAEAIDAEIHGCDIDGASVVWLDEHLSPPFHVFLNGAEPPLDQPSSSYDLIWGISVFTHLTDTWSRWLIELYRLLVPQGLLYLTFSGRGMSSWITGEQWDETRVGMNVLKYGQGWDLGGPMVVHSPWWIKEHWGRAFEIISLVPDGFASETSFGQGSVLMRKRDVAIDVPLLEQMAPDDPREALALSHNVAQLCAESATLRRECQDIKASLATSRQRCSDLEAQLAEIGSQFSTLTNSRSWRLTKPLRFAAQKARAARG